MLCKENLEDLIPLTPMQEGMIFHTRLNPDTLAYREQLTFTIEGPLNTTSFAAAWQKLVSRHQVFRSVFPLEKTKKPLMMVLKEVESTPTLLDITNLSPDEQDARVQRLREEDRRRGFALDKELAHRLILFQTTPESHILLFSFHHAILDGWSLGVVFEELLLLYREEISGIETGLSAPPLFASFIKKCQTIDIDTSLSAWKAALSGYDRLTTVPCKMSAPGESQHPALHRFFLDEETTGRINVTAAHVGVTFNTLFQSIWAVILGRYNSTDDILFGATASGRNLPVDNIENMVGLLINTIPTRIATKRSERFDRLAKRVQASQLEMMPHHHASLADIQQHTDLKSSLLDHIIVFENLPDPAGINTLIPGICISSIRMYEQINYDFEIVVTPGAKTDILLQYDSNVFEPSWIGSIEGHIRRVIEQVIDCPAIPVNEITLTGHQDITTITKLNDTTATYPAKSIDALFDTQATKTPNAPAVIDSGATLSYRELAEQANGLAAMIIERGVKSGDKVAFLIKRSPMTIVSILAILKAGATYVPLDIEYPVERLEFMLHDSGVKLVLADDDSIDHPTLINHVTLNISQTVTPITKAPATNSPNSIAYIIYTSGSTGKPKGCMVSHNNLIRLFINDRFLFDFGPSDRWIIAHSFSFDFSVWEMYGALLYGGCLVVPHREDVRDTMRFRRILAENNVTILNTTPAAFYNLIAEETQHEAGALSSVRQVIFGGDKLEPSYLKPWVERYPLADCSLINMYGITETTVHVTCHKITMKDIDTPGISPVGGPLPETELYLLDHHLNHQPVGVTGEIYVGGSGVCCGYLNRAELTAERFIDNPFKHGTSMYRTGDTGRLVAGGGVEYFGRSDFQVQIRGFRIEPGEIEARILAHPDIAEALVIPRTSSSDDMLLVGYLKTRTSAHLSQSDLKAWITGFLPDYMVPAHFVHLETFPLTPNGKIDRSALPEPFAHARASEKIEAKTEIEQELTLLWSDILGMDDLSTADNFFELGGHSLTATRLCSRINKQFGVKIDLRDFFYSPTIRTQADLVTSAAAIKTSPITPLAKAESYPLSATQRRMWVLDNMEEKLTAYNMTGAFTITGPLDIAVLQQAFLGVCSRHEALRTKFCEIEGEPRQIIQPNPFTNAFSVSDLSHKDNFSSAADRRCKELAATIFNLTNGPLCFAEVITLGPDNHRLVIVMHHIISDGWSISLMINELSTRYNDSGAELAPLDVHFKDFAVWQNQQLLEDGDLVASRTFWHKTFTSEIPLLDLRTDRLRPAVQSFQGKMLRHELPLILLDKAKALAASRNISLFMLLQAVLGTLIYRYNGQTDIVIGAPVNGRVHENTEQMLGFFANTVPFRIRFDATDTVSILLDKIREHSTQAFTHQCYPFDRLVDELEIKRDLSRSPLFDLAMSLTTKDSGFQLELGDCRIVEAPLDPEISKFDLTFFFSESDEGITLDLEYSTDLFDEGRMLTMAGHFESLLGSMINQPDAPLEELPIMSASEKKWLFYELNNTDRTLPNMGIPERFYQMVETCQDSTALVWNNRPMSYFELNEESNRIAHSLIDDYLVRPGERIALMVGRGAFMVKAILGILKTGASYVPLESSYPSDRLAHILADSGCRVLITDEASEEVTDKLPVWTVVMENDLQSVKHTNPEPLATADSAAYVVYTSGSTGAPKGVLIRQRSVINLVHDARHFTAGPGDAFAGISTYAFDGSVFDIFGSLLNGATYHPVPEDQLLDMHGFGDFLRKRQITRMFITTALFNKLVDADPGALSGIGKIFFGGQEASVFHVRKALEYRHNDEALVHVYGPTETTVFATYHIVRVAHAHATCIPIGLPLSNYQCHILDKQLRPVPANIAGELYIAGDGLAQEYLNNPELTAERFIYWDAGGGMRMYKTGDLCRRTPDGAIEFLSRADTQVKIRGFRVEIGEVENALLAHEQIRQVSIVVRKTEDFNNEMIGYLVMDHVNSPCLNKLRSFLLERLPEYMIPAYFVPLDNLPLNPNGKVDKKQLPSPEKTALGTESKSIADLNLSPREEDISAAFAAVLGIAAPGLDDNYFALGGDSIKAIRLVSHLRERGYHLTVKDIFTAPTVAELALTITSAGVQQQTVERLSGPVALTPVQRWFFDAVKAEPHHFNQHVLLMTSAPIDASALKKAVFLLADNHDALRATYEIENGTPFQHIAGNVPEGIFRQVNLSASDELTATCECYQKGFDLENGPLFKVVYLTAEGTERILLLAHHLVVDGVSWRILADDLAKAYHAFASNMQPDIPSPVANLKIWTEAIATYRDSLAHQQTRLYWNRFPEITGEAPTGQATSHRLILDEETTTLLVHEAHNAYGTTVDDLLSAACTRSWRQLSGEMQCALIREGHGRNMPENDIDMSRTVGWFTAIYPTILDVADDIALHIKQTKESLRAVPHGGFDYQLSDTTREFPPLSLNYLGSFDEESTGTFFSLAKEDAGSPTSPLNARLCQTDIICEIARRCLAITVVGGTDSPASPEAIAASFKDELVAIINHCVSRKDAELTPSDIDFDGFALDELDDVLDRFEDN